MKFKNMFDLNKNDADDFQNLYLSYFNELYRFAFHYIMSEDAKDIVQDVFEKLFDNRHKIGKDVNMRAYLYALTKNRCIDYLKHLSVHSRHQDAIIDSILKNVDYDYEGENEISSKINNIVEMLPVMQQKIIKLRLEGKSYEEISQILNIKPGSVNTHISRVYKRIKSDYNFLFVILSNLN